MALKMHVSLKDPTTFELLEKQQWPKSLCWKCALRCTGIACTVKRNPFTNYKALLHLCRQMKSTQCKSFTSTTTTTFHRTNATIIITAAAEVLDKMHTNRVKTSKGRTLNVDKFQESGSTTFQGCVLVCACVQDSECVRACGPNHLKSWITSGIWGVTHVEKNIPPFSNQTRYLNCTLLLFSTKAMTENVQ